MRYECQIIEISGNHFDRGVQYGEQANEKIRNGLGHYSKQLEGLGFDRARVHQFARAYLPIMEDYAAEYVDELRGIAKGADVDLEDIAFLNARTEIMKLGISPHLMESLGFSDYSDECTAALALPGATANDNMVIGQNWDNKMDCAESIVVLRVRREDGPEVLTFTEAGQLGRSGMNSAGIGVVSNYLECERDFQELGVPLVFTRRKLLESAYIAEMVGLVYNSHRTGSNNLLIAHTGGVGMGLECAPDEVFHVNPTDGLLVHTNHWIAESARSRVKETGVNNSADTLSRWMRAEQILRPEIGSITRGSLKRTFLDDYQSPYSICRPPRSSERHSVSATVGTVVMEPAAGIMEVSILPALDAKFKTFTLEVDQSAVAASASRHRPESARP